jgi:hypothetical protein
MYLIGQLHAFVTGTHFVEGWLCPRACLDNEEKRKCYGLAEHGSQIHQSYSL